MVTASPNPTRSTRPSRAAKSLHKGQQTKAAIVDAALGMAAQVGLEGLSIGSIADMMHMSKSGVFAHFGSREDLQISVVHEYHHRFEQEVFVPALTEARGLPRLRALFENWVRRTAVEIDSGCVYISGAVDFDDRPGPVRDALEATANTWQAAVRRAVVLAIDAGHLSHGTDPAQVAFEIHGLILVVHYEARFLRNPDALNRARQGFANMLERYTPKP
jgi:AcrR family transcriptional regulator